MRTTLIIGSAPVPSQDGSYDGVVTVKFNVQDGKDPSKASGYECSLLLAGTTNPPPMTWEDCEDFGRTPSAHPLLCGAQGTFVVGVTGGRL